MLHCKMDEKFKIIIMNNINEEPFFLPINTNNENLDYLSNNQKFRQEQKFIFYRNAIDFLRDNSIYGDYYEFGVHKARTFSMCLSINEFFPSQVDSLFPRVLNNFYAFDSFKGLPSSEEVNKHVAWNQGALSTNQEDFLLLLEKYVPNYKSKVQCIQGFYEDTLNDTLSKNLISLNSRISLITIDCDLYKSYKSCFDFIEPFLQDGTVIYIDDWNLYKGHDQFGAQKAFIEFISKSGYKYKNFMDVGWWGKSFIAQKK
jgi:hypothetical protein